MADPYTAGAGAAPNDNSVADIIRKLRDETTMLVQQEMALAKTELSEKAGRVGRNVGYLAIGGLIAYAGLIFLLHALSVGLADILNQAGVGTAAAWLAPLIVGLLVLFIGYGLVQKAMHTFKHETVIPEKTAASLKENKEWAKQKVG